MSDSEKEPKPLPVELPEGTKSLVVRNQPNKEGIVTTREVLVNEKGRFVKKPKPLIPTIEFTRSERKLLNKVRSDKDGLSEYMVAFMNILRIAQHASTDAKEMMAAVKAFEVLRLSALGKPAPSEQELDKLQTQPIKVVILQAPQLMHPEVQEEKRFEEKTQPSFIDAEIVKQN
jgi:hypothetical protein